MAATDTLSPEDIEFLAKCEEDLKHRFTDKDEEFMKVFNLEPSVPPIVEPWWVSNNSGRRNDWRDNRRPHPYERPGNRGRDSYNRRDRNNFDRKDGNSYDRRDGNSYDRRDGNSYDRRDGNNYDRRDGNSYDRRDGNNYDKRDGNNYDRRDGNNDDRRDGNSYEKRDRDYQDMRGYKDYDDIEPDTRHQRPRY